MTYTIIFESLSLYRRVLTLLVASLVATLIVLLAWFVFDSATIRNDLAAQEPSGFPSIGTFLSAIVIAPVLETVVFQMGLLMLAKKFFEITGITNNWMPAFVLVVFSFALIHGLGADTPYLFLMSALTRLPLSICLAIMAVAEYRKVDGMPFFGVVLLHSGYNTSVFLAAVLLELLTSKF